MISMTDRGLFRVTGENGVKTYGIYPTIEDAEKRQQQVNQAQGIEQVVEIPKKRRGRPPGSKNKTRENELNASTNKQSSA